MANLATRTTMKDLWRCWNDLENATTRYSARLGEEICKWRDDGCWITHPAPAQLEDQDRWAAYLAKCWRITDRRVRQLEAGGRARRELGTLVPPKMLGTMGETHLREFAPLKDDPELIEEAVAEVEALADEKEKKRGILAKTYRKAVKAVQARHAPTPGWEPEKEEAPTPVYHMPSIGTPLQRARDSLKECIRELRAAAMDPPEGVQAGHCTAEADTLENTHLSKIAGWAAR